MIAPMPTIFRVRSPEIVIIIAFQIRKHLSDCAVSSLDVFDKMVETTMYIVSIGRFLQLLLKVFPQWDVAVLFRMSICKQINFIAFPTHRKRIFAKPQDVTFVVFVDSQRDIVFHLYSPYVILNGWNRRDLNPQRRAVSCPRLLPNWATAPGFCVN